MKTEKNIAERISNKKVISDKMILLFFSLLFSVFIMFTFLIPKYEQMKINEMEIELIERTLASKEEIFVKLASFNRTYKDISEKDINKMYNLLPDSNNFEEHLANIDRLAKINGILIKDISFLEDKKQKDSDANSHKNNLKITNVSFSLESKFPNFMSFLDSLEKSIPAVNVKNLSITKNEKNDGGNDPENARIDRSIEAEVSLSFYHL